MRGKLLGVALRADILRITPAHAGKTTSARRVALPSADHPRACGENHKPLLSTLFAHGSPPRMRGKLGRNHKFLKEIRITPAHAGKTPGGYGSAPQGTDHPRACGENPLESCQCGGRCGSPPRMRGKPSPRRRSRGASRITPAHAGKTALLMSPPFFRTDHPRACGENIGKRSTSQAFHGSPPRMRGKLTAVLACPSQLRITPAHAGKTYRNSARPYRYPDHPRACGENP